MIRAAGLALVAFGILCVWSAWANVNPWDEVQASFVSGIVSRPIDPAQPQKKKATTP